jgi:serine/threonine protein kinase
MDQVEILGRTEGDNTSSDRYAVRGKLGEGAFGDIRLGIDRITGRKVALKFIRVLNKDDGLPRALFRELEALRQLKGGQNIVSIIDMFPDETNLCLVLEYLVSDLSEVVSQASSPLPVAHIKSYAFMLLSALSFIHSRNVIHRDIKPSNILLSNTGILKLADFGLARVIMEKTLEASSVVDRPVSYEDFPLMPTPLEVEDSRDLSHQVATRWYRPPELLFASRSYTFSADIWSAAVVIAELFALRPLFQGNNDIDQMFRVFQIMGSPCEENWSGVSDLPDFSKVNFAQLRPISLSLIIPHMSEVDVAFLQTLLVLDPSKRRTATESCVDAYFICPPLPTNRVFLPCPGRQSKKNASRGGLSKAQSIKSDEINAETPGLQEWEKESLRIHELLNRE